MKVWPGHRRPSASAIQPLPPPAAPGALGTPTGGSSRPNSDVQSAAPPTPPRGAACLSEARRSAQLEIFLTAALSASYMKLRRGIRDGDPADERESLRTGYVN